MNQEPTETMNAVAKGVVDAAIEIHRALGPGLLEKAYRRCLALELQQRGLVFQAEVPIAIVYKDLRLEDQYRIDFLVDDSVVVEVKAIENLLPVHHAQLLTYLRMMDKRLGLLLNFNVPLMKDGIARRVNSRSPPRPMPMIH